jgi:plasmid maintenance system antidote protein VapI
VSMRQFSVDQITEELRKMCAGSTQAQVARELGIMRSNLCHILAGRKRLGYRLATKMGFVKLPDRYVKGGK